MYIGLHVKYRYCCQILMKLEFCRRIFEKYSNVKFHENPSIGSGVVPCGQTDRQADMTTLIVAYKSMTSTSQRNSSYDCHSIIFLNETK
jgi:hypothetical protein